VDPTKITLFEQKFSEHIKATNKPLLDQIAKDGMLSEASDKALQKIVVDFLSTFNK
jgi:F0F1-type ATP synthase alpha subunit